MSRSCSEPSPPAAPRRADDVPSIRHSAACAQPRAQGCWPSIELAYEPECFVLQEAVLIAAGDPEIENLERVAHLCCRRRKRRTNIPDRLAPAAFVKVVAHSGQKRRHRICADRPDPRTTRGPDESLERRVEARRDAESPKRGRDLDSVEFAEAAEWIVASLLDDLAEPDKPIRCFLWPA
jgi:ribosomal protein L32